MITCEDLRKGAEAALDSVAAPLRVTRLEPGDHPTPDTEEYVVIHRAPRTDIDGLVSLWSAYLRAKLEAGDLQVERIADFAARAEPGSIGEAEFNDLVAGHTSGASRPALPLHASHGFIGALRVYADWNFVLALAEYEDELIAFEWQTTA